MPPRNLRGIALMVCAVAVFASMDALLKILSAHYPPLQVSALRGFASLPIIALPYLLTLIAVTGLLRKSAAPAGLGKHATEH